LAASSSARWAEAQLRRGGDAASRARAVDIEGALGHTAHMSGLRCMLMRGGTSKGAYFLAEDLPENPDVRDDLLLRLMGSPDPRQIDGIGGAHPLTSKVAVISKSESDDADIDYLFLQTGVDEAFVTDQQNCGNILAGVAPFALERGLLRLGDGEAQVRIKMLNTDSIATATFPVRDGEPIYTGDTSIAGVPGAAAEVRIDFENTAGSSCGALLPTGNVVDKFSGIRVTCIDNGMPVIVMLAEDVGITGYESPAELEANAPLRKLLEEIRLEAGPLMKLGDVAKTSVPKLTMVAPAREGGSLCTRTFIPHRCHDAIGVLGAVSVATAAFMAESPASSVLSAGEHNGVLVVEHPTGTFDVAIDLDLSGPIPSVRRSGIIRTARKLFDGTVFPREY
jgi:4-oxalomesaconate tautomerase